MDTLLIILGCAVIGWLVGKGLNHLFSDNHKDQKSEGDQNKIATIEEGKEEEKRKTALNLLNMNIDIPTIEKATGLSESEILKLKDNTTNSEEKIAKIQEEEKRKTALNLLNMNIDIPTIEKATGLSETEILKLKNKE